MLTFLFDAVFSDGSFITQNEDDVSLITPGKNCFYDVLQRIDEVVTFELFDHEHSYAVDLRDGHFEIDGLLFQAHDPDIRFPPDAKFRLVYFKRNRIHHCGGEITGIDTVFHVGWQTTIDGKNYKQTISVS